MQFTSAASASVSATAIPGMAQTGTGRRTGPQTSFPPRTSQQTQTTSAEPLSPSTACERLQRVLRFCKVIRVLSFLRPATHDAVCHYKSPPPVEGWRDKLSHPPIHLRPLTAPSDSPRRSCWSDRLRPRTDYCSSRRRLVFLTLRTKWSAFALSLCPSLSQAAEPPNATKRAWLLNRAPASNKPQTLFSTAARSILLEKHKHCHITDAHGPLHRPSQLQSPTSWLHPLTIPHRAITASLRRPLTYARTSEDWFHPFLRHL
ncbi:hypothetical protein CC80DRAFT_260069 [Byssothecium circinans]|uniref:Uncharacterized protein n=1 Tax=Byssothecium circinans TaxID=147558 RepID=A0A6A5U7C8_9PLEO|nr:hypothetical protein CC80DRAFT_260069 [Byssothecium circinans]